MSATNTSTFFFSAQNIAVYMGVPILFAGIIGEIVNCIVFLSLRTFRENTCAFYLIIMSFVNIGQLLTSLFPRIMINAFDVDWAQTSLWYCKFRIYLLQLCTLMSYTCICLATIDQYLATCFKPFWQQLSNIKVARILVLIFFIIWSLHGIPFLIYLDVIVSPTTNELTCSYTNPILLQYFSYGFIVTLAGFLPVFVTILFGFLAYRNVTTFAFRQVPLIRRELDKQLSVMVLVEVIFNCLTTIPYIITYILILLPRVINNPLRFAQLSLASSVLVNIYYLHYAVSRKFVSEMKEEYSKSFSRRHSTYICVYRKDFVINSSMFSSIFTSINGVNTSCPSINHLHNQKQRPKEQCIIFYRYSLFSVFYLINIFIVLTREPIELSNRF